MNTQNSMSMMPIPTQSQMNGMSQQTGTQSTRTSEIRIEVVTASRIPEIFKIQQDFLSNKRTCCIIPLSLQVSESDFTKRYTKDPASMQVAAVAVDVTNNEALGFVQLYFHGMYCEMHTVKPGEAYVDSIAVLPQARGKGVGTKLMAWCEEIARAKGADRLSLGVIRGNPAIGLYEKLGYAQKQDDTPCDTVCTAAFVCCFFGCPYGIRNPTWGAMDMVKPLPK
mmetsp:Transcript_98095/g.158166  ORF Transcript_98095/g.158166 Transcript_98095/m.158166 type:complete len:224 (+) Transcript_98095:51-722(+)